jgi:multidrug resistance efflux pump
MRLITGRLIENQSTLMALAKGHPAESTGVDPASVAPVTGDTLRAHKPSSGRLKRLRVATSPYFLGAVFVTAAIVIYAGWSIGPYLQSVFFRDAAVTTWVHIATSPIKGNLNNVSLTPGQRVGSDGRIALVRNEQADRSEVDRSQAEIVRAQAKFGELETYLTRIQLLDSEFRERTVGYAVNFKKVLAIEITGGKREVAHLDKQLKLMRDLAERKVSLARRGAASRTSADNALAETKALGRTRAERLRDIALSQQRLDAAKGSVFLTGDGRVPEWAYRSQDTLRLEIARTTMALADAKSDRAKARITADAARELFQTTSESSINAPAGSLVWSVFANNGQAVEIGTQIVEWIDCREILVDVPTSDVEIPLLRAGSPADVVIEGEAKARKGTVLMTRGGASSLNDSQLAAVAKGRRSGTSHAIVNLEVTPGDAQDCPVGRAASVNFPEINIIDLIRARLRF